jgi:hypothetical protein
MSDRKYRQRGYQDEPREPRGDRKPEQQKKEYAPRGQPPIAPKTFNMPGFREVVKCAQCGGELSVATAWSVEGQCPRCQADLHSCAQCTHFDTGAAFECHKPIAVRVSPKNTRNTCTHFEPRARVERETTSTSSPSAPSSAKKAFDDLFK